MLCPHPGRSEPSAVCLVPGTVGESNADHDVLCFAGDAADEGNDAVGDRCELYATCLPPTAG